jgi:hypothetical protein
MKILNIIIIIIIIRSIYVYCNRFDERVARQQLCKHGPTRNNKGSCVFRVLGDVTTVDSDHVTCFLYIRPTHQ